MKSDVFLVVPPVEVGRDVGNTIQPLGVLYLASSLKKAGIGVSVLDWRVKDLAMEDIISMVKKMKPLMVGISIMTAHVPITLELCSKLKKECPEIAVCLGGPHINGTGKEMLKFSRDIDFLVYGEGEDTVVELAKELPKGTYSAIKGLIYTEKGKIRVNPPRPFLDDTDRLPFPDFSMVDLADYSIFSGSNSNVASIMTSRGCPFNCAFCDVHTTMGRKLRLRSVDNVLDEIEQMVRSFGIKGIFIKDSTFTIRKDWVHDFCSELIRRKISIEWICNTRVDCVDQPLLRDMAEAGCKQISYGIESADRQILRNINKDIDPEQARNAFKMTKRAGIKIQGFFMIGNPGETVKTVKKTIKFAKELSPDSVVFTPTMAYPNTDIYYWAIKHKALKNPHWYMKRTSQSTHLSFSEGQLHLPELTPDQQRIWVRRAHMQHYFRPAYMLRKLRQLSNLEQFGKHVKAAWRIIAS